MANNKNPAIDESLIPLGEKAAYDAMSDQEKAEYFGFGQGTIGNFDVPEYISIKEETVLQNGLSWGGHFKDNYDPVHFDFRKTLPYNKRQALAEAAIKNGILPTQQETGRYT